MIGSNKIHFLKGYWQDCILLESNNHFALIDTGFKDNYIEIKESFDQLGIKDFEFILITHFHRDHYGNVENIIRDYNVKTVYLKEYSGLDKYRADGKGASDEYRKQEKEKYQAIFEYAKTRSNLVVIDDLVDELNFYDYNLKLYNTKNLIKEIYEDKNSPYYHQIVYSENINSIMLLLKIANKKILLGGDLICTDSLDKKAHELPNKIAKEINCEVDFFKLNHHGVVEKLSIFPSLKIYKPKVVVITNDKKYITEKSKIDLLLAKVSPNTKIYYTDQNITFEIKN